MPDYSVTLNSTGAGSRTLPVGTIFPPTRIVDYDETGKQTKVITTYSFRGRFQLLTETANFNAFQDLLDFAKNSKKVSVVFAFGGSTLLTLPLNARGPRIRNCGLVQRAGSLATHAEFQIDIEDILDPTIDGQSAGNLQRAKTANKYDERLFQTIYRAAATGEDALVLVMAMKPSDNGGPIQESVVVGVDGLSAEATWTIDTPDAVGSYLTWERTIKITEGGSPINEVRTIGRAVGGNVLSSGPVLRRMPDAAATVTDTSRITTLGKWKGNVPDITFLLPAEFRDPTRSRGFDEFQIIDRVRDIWSVESIDFYVVNEPAKVLAASSAIKSGLPPPKAVITAPTDADGWSDTES